MTSKLGVENNEPTTKKLCTKCTIELVQRETKGEKAKMKIENLRTREFLATFAAGFVAGVFFVMMIIGVLIQAYGG